MEEIEKATFDHLVELQLQKEGYLHHAFPMEESRDEDHKQKLSDQGHHLKYASIPMIDQAEAATPRHVARPAEVPENDAEAEAKAALDMEIARLQKDLKSITAKIEDYNFSQNKLERELGYGVKKDVDGKSKGCSKSQRRKSEASEGAKSPSLPLLGAGLTLTAGGVDEADPYMRQNTAMENAYTRQSTILTNDTLLTESVVEGTEAHKQKTGDEKFLKIQL